MEFEHLLTKCSICFDSQLDFCLKRCRDQFCQHCFERYITELVKNSWGLTIQTICCPVCNDPLDQSEWASYIDEETVELYNYYNRPFRSLTRTCENCETNDICASPTPKMDQVSRKRCFEDILRMVEKICILSGTIDAYGLEVLSTFQSNFRIHFGGGPVEVHLVYLPLIERLEHLIQKSISKEKSEKMVLLQRISSNLVTLELCAEKWSIMQFRHVSRFPKVECTLCYETMCFSCGVAPFHQGRNCQEHMSHLISTRQGSEETLQTLIWKLANSKRCPNCSVLINREEGCNKVDCLFCGHKFCWHCLGTFDNGNCGYYRCQIVGTNNRISDHTELGVPNIHKIHSSVHQVAH